MEDREINAWILSICGIHDEDAFDRIDEEGCSPIFASLLYG